MDESKPAAKATTITYQQTRQRKKLAQLRLETVQLSAELEALRRQSAASQQQAARITTLEALVQQLQEANQNLLKSRLDISHLAHRDFLTNLPNRSQLDDRLILAAALALRNNKKLAVLFLDLDRFKSVNDSLGHSIGDKLLQAVADRLRAGVRTSDSVSRQGGDEFVILLSEIEGTADAALIADKVLQALALPYLIDGHTLQITASMGISVFPNDATHADVLIRHADAAMYHAKDSGRSQYQFFTQEMHDRAVERLTIEGSLQHALDTHEFVLHYQPKINLASGTLSGVEALIRWQHPTLGLLNPVEFIAVAEACGLIIPIDQWALREACVQAEAWRATGLLSQRIAVNISAPEFHAPGFVAHVRQILDDSGFPASHLELEMTESVLMDDTASTMAVLAELKSLGISLTIDDFGTGYSSLSYLKRFPTDVLKIDQSFIKDLLISADNAVLVNAMIGIGASLKQTVIAEGIETLQQLAFLRAHHCEEGQGYYISHPLPAAEFSEWLKRGFAHH